MWTLKTISMSRAGPFGMHQQICDLPLNVFKAWYVKGCLIKRSLGQKQMKSWTCSSRGSWTTPCQEQGQKNNRQRWMNVIWRTMKLILMQFENFFEGDDFIGCAWSTLDHRIWTQGWVSFWYEWHRGDRGCSFVSVWMMSWRQRMLICLSSFRREISCMAVEGFLLLHWDEFLWGQQTMLLVVCNWP